MLPRGTTLTLLAAALVQSGCGAATGEKQVVSTTQTETAAPVSIVESGGWGVEMAETALPGERVSLADDLAVFARPPRPEDEFPGITADVRADTAEGSELPARSRLLLRGVAKESFDDIGDQTLSLYALPTENGWVCAYVLYEDLGDFADGAAGACEHGLIHGFGLEMQGDGRFYRLYGVVEDGIQRVSLRVGDRLIPTRVGSNGFYFHARTTDVCPVDIEHLVVERVDGSSTTVSWSLLAPTFVGANRDSYGCR